MEDTAHNAKNARHFGISRYHHLWRNNEVSLPPLLPFLPPLVQPPHGPSIGYPPPPHANRPPMPMPPPLSKEETWPPLLMDPSSRKKKHGPPPQIFSPNCT